MAKDTLFTPITIGGVQLKNRIALAPMCTSWCTPDGQVTPQQCRYYHNMAKSGPGLIVVESFMATVDARSGKIRNNIHDDRFIPAARTLTDAIHAGGAKACGIIHHAGGVTTPADISRFPVAPSAVPVDLKGERLIGLIPRALKTGEVEALVTAFGEGALRLKRAGFDIILILAAHGYLINQFLSPYHNVRTDRYGGSGEKRMRFLLDIVAEVQRRVGDTPLMVRLSSSENFRGGYTFDYILRESKALQRAGVHSINYSNGNYHSFEYNIPSHHGQRCLNVRYARRAKAALDIPVSVVGRITSPEECRRILDGGKADMVWLGRQLLADTDWVQKARTGQGRIRYCLGCNLGCIGRFFQGHSIRCAVNHRIGHEEFYQRMEGITPRQRRLLVVGGGAAGMEAAAVAAARGHRVTLIESGDRLGGQLTAAGIPPCKEACHQLRDFLEERLEQTGVEVRLGTPLSKAVVEQVRPDIVAVACGSAPHRPPIPGAERETVRFAEDFLRSGRTDYSSAVIIGGGEIGVETAEYLLAAGCERVTILEAMEDVMQGGEAHTKRQTLLGLLGMGCDIRVCTEVLEIGDGWVRHQPREPERFDGPEQTPADIVLLATGYRAVRPEGLEGLPAVRLAPLDKGNILESIAAGAAFAMTLGTPEEQTTADKEETP